MLQTDVAFAADKSILFAVAVAATTPITFVPVPANISPAATVLGYVAVVATKFVPLPLGIVPVAADPPIVNPVVIEGVTIVGEEPKEVSDEAVTPLAKVAPVNVPAAAATVIAPLPSKFTPLIARAVCSVVAVVALPESAPVKVVDVNTPAFDNVITVFISVPPLPACHVRVNGARPAADVGISVSVKEAVESAAVAVVPQ